MGADNIAGRVDNQGGAPAIVDNRGGAPASGENKPPILVSGVTPEVPTYPENKGVLAQINNDRKAGEDGFTITKGLASNPLNKELEDMGVLSLAETGQGQPPVAAVKPSAGRQPAAAEDMVNATGQVITEPEDTANESQKAEVLKKQQRDFVMQKLQSSGLEPKDQEAILKLYDKDPEIFDKSDKLLQGNGGPETSKPEGQTGVAAEGEGSTPEEAKQTEAERRREAVKSIFDKLSGWKISDSVKGSITRALTENPDRLFDAEKAIKNLEPTDDPKITPDNLMANAIDNRLQAIEDSESQGNILNEEQLKERRALIMLKDALSKKGDEDENLFLSIIMAMVGGAIQGLGEELKNNFPKAIAPENS